MRDVRELLRRVYNEISSLDSLRRQREMVIQDNSGMKAIQYEAEKVRGGKYGDLGEVIENIERQAARLDALIAGQIERIMKHREEAYQLLERIPESPGKSAVQEHYLYHVSWEELSGREHYSISYLKDMARKCIEKLQEICDAQM